MKGAPGLVAIVLDNETASFLKERAVHPNVFCNHVTLAYRPNPEVYGRYAPLLGDRVSFFIIEEGSDERGQAVVVDLEGCPCENEVPHVTVSCADGTKPSYSKTLLSTDPREGWRFVGKRGRGTVQYVPL